jgi:hypothetical protein
MSVRVPRATGAVVEIQLSGNGCSISSLDVISYENKNEKKIA